jgi:hypothetical protein
VPALLLEARKLGPLGEEIGVGPLQILERLLQRVSRGIGQPCRVCAVAPLGEQLAQRGIAELVLALFVARLLQRQRLVEHEPAGAGEAAHLALLRTAPASVRT